jgi:hypothetical protein
MTNDLVKRLRDKIEASKIYDDDITLASIVRVINREELFDADCKIEGSEMSNDLVKRLSWWAFKFCGKGEQENLASDAMSEAVSRIEKLETALRRLIDYGMVSHQDLERARKALGEEENEEA